MTLNNASSAHVSTVPTKPRCLLGQVHHKSCFGSRLYWLCLSWYVVCITHHLQPVSALQLPQLYLSNMISRNDFLATAATTLLTTVKVSSSSQYDALPKPYEHLSSERIAQIFNNVDAYAVCQKNGVGDYKLYSGILPTRLHAEAVLDAARRDNPGDSFFLADGSFGDCYFKVRGCEI